MLFMCSGRRNYWREREGKIRHAFNEYSYSFCNDVAVSFCYNYIEDLN